MPLALLANLTQSSTKTGVKLASRDAPTANERDVAAIVLAAGASTRMRDANKLLLPWPGAGGIPIVACVVDQALASRARPVVVVTGHEQAAVRATLGSRPVQFVHNPDHGLGLSASLRVGLSCVSDCDGALVCLGDMPRVRVAHLDALIDAFASAGGSSVCVPTCEGRRGNPVLWPARCFAAMCALQGDVGARELLAAETPVRVELDAAVLFDVDQPADLRT